MEAIAATIEALDVSMVGAALGRPGALREVTATRIGTGQVAMSLRLDLEWVDGTDADAPDTVIAKIPAPEPQSREAARLMRTYHLEVGFYRDVSPLVSIPHPQAFHAAIDDPSGDFTLLMATAPGEVGDQIAGCTFAQAAAMVDGAVGLHAPTWDRVNALGSLPWLGLPDPAAIAMRVGAYAMLLPGFQQRFADRLSAEVLEAASWLGAHLGEVIAAYRSPMCLTHGDFRLDNMLFVDTASMSAVTVLDWQTVGFGRGATDVAYGIGSGLVGDDRRRHEAALVDRYIDGLAATGVDVVADDVRIDYRLGTVSGLAMAVIASQLVASTERGDEMFAVMAERHAAQMADNDVFALV